MIEWLKQSWHGFSQLWKVFWVAGITIFFIEVIIAFTRVALGFEGLVADLLHLPVSLAMSVWWWVSVWRCAFNTHLSMWGYLARIIVALQAAFAAFAIMGLILAVSMIEVAPY